MKTAVPTKYIQTLKELCRMCYTCVRECPSKAIRIIEGQAEVIAERCIACGNCVRVCSQNAKQVLSSVGEFEEILAGGGRVAALVAPSFPAEFTEYTSGEFAGLLRHLGFEIVAEVAFGADLVAARYAELINAGKHRRWIATTCPAVIGYVERYYPQHAALLAPIVSPMVASARVVRARYGADVKTIFIGPCIAKKVEASSRILPDEVDAVITFRELREVIANRGVKKEQLKRADFDPPHASLGALFPISRGLLQAAGLREDLMTSEVVCSSGRGNFTEALSEFTDGNVNAGFLEVLCCRGCIMGPGMATSSPMFQRRSEISRHARERMEHFQEKQWRKDMRAFAQLDLSRKFAQNDQRLSPPAPRELEEILRRMGKDSPEDELNCGACGYDSCREHAIAVLKGLAESEMCLPFTIDKLKKTVKELALSNDQLASMQEALMQSEKLASMGQLAAGIAHELNNPLGIVLMYAHLLLEECEQNSMMQEDLNMIADQADRCKRIVSSLLHFSRQNKLLRQPTDLHHIIEKSIQLVPTPESTAIHFEPNLKDPVCDMDGDQFIQVFTNLLSNALGAMPQGGMVTIRTEEAGEAVRFSVSDTGVGIPAENRKRIFDPFFTTKQLGIGTGLGLAVVYGIVKAHKGEIRVTSNADSAAGPTGTSFVIEIPRQQGQENGK